MQPIVRMNRTNTFSFLSSDQFDSTGLPAFFFLFCFFVLCWLYLLFIFISVCILIWIMQEVSEEEEGCERGVPHSMCPWLFFAPALLRVEQVGVCVGVCVRALVCRERWGWRWSGGRGERRAVGRGGLAARGAGARILGLTPAPPSPHHHLLLACLPACLLAYLAGSLVGFNNSV